VLTDQGGLASTYITPLAAGSSIITAKLAPASYPIPQQVQTTLTATESQLDISLFTPPVWVSQGASVTIPLVARLLSNGAPVSGGTVNYRVTSGVGILSSGSAQSDGNGFATVSLQLNSIALDVQVNVCAASAPTVCQLFTAAAVAASSLQLQPVSAGVQIVAAGQSFQPVAARVTDSATPPHAVLGATVMFQNLVGLLPATEPVVWAGEAGISQPTVPVIIANAQVTAQSDINGLASFLPSTAGVSGNVAIVVTASVGNRRLTFEAEQLGP
jgi:hypothetical protein